VWAARRLPRAPNPSHHGSRALITRAAAATDVGRCAKVGGPLWVDFPGMHRPTSMACWSGQAPASAARLGWAQPAPTRRGPSHARPDSAQPAPPRHGPSHARPDSAQPAPPDAAPATPAQFGAAKTSHTQPARRGHAHPEPHPATGSAQPTRPGSARPAANHCCGRPAVKLGASPPSKREQPAPPHPRVRAPTPGRPTPTPWHASLRHLRKVPTSRVSEAAAHLGHPGRRVGQARWARRDEIGRHDP
jgi:hypothetical protein